MDYILRNIDRELWRLVKIRAAQEGRPIRDAIIDFLRWYVTDEPENEEVTENETTPN